MNLSLCNINIKNFNKRVSLDLIRFTPGGISRADLARRIGLTRSAVTTIVNDLISLGLVHEAENGPATGGRRPILLEINPQRGFIVGIDMGATHLGLLLTDFSARVLNEVVVPFDVTRPPETCLEQVDHQVHALVSAAGVTIDQVMAIGMGVPGPVVAEAGLVSVPPIMPGWDGFPIRDRLQQVWNCPVSLNNDAELGALGEWAYGAGRGERNLAYIKVGSGVGAGLLLDGQIYRGATGAAGEIGHITLQDEGPLCSCGNHGCLEVMAGGMAIARKAQQAVASGRRTQLSTVQPVEAITASDVAAAARLGDLVAQKIVTETGYYLGTAIANLVNLFNPGMVVVGGRVSQIGDLLLQPIRQTVRERSLKSSSRGLQINAAVLGHRSSSMGAVVQALNMVLDRITEI